MPVLGCGGKLKLRREAPGACVITSDSVDWNTNTFDLECPGYWSGTAFVSSTKMDSQLTVAMGSLAIVTGWLLTLVAGGS